MKVPDITEEERAEIFVALRERKENLEKLEKKTQEATIPTDRFEERLALYRDRDELVKGENGTEKHLRPGLLATFAPTPELSTEALENQTRKTDGRPDLFGGGAETGGGGGAPNGSAGTWKPKGGRKKGQPEHIGDIITPPAPREPLGLPAVGTPSNADHVFDPTPRRPTEEGIAELRQAVKVDEEAAEEESDPERDRLATAAAAATPSGRQIVDVRADGRDTKMGGSTDPLPSVE
jgi:hypothetical protein